MDKQTRVLQKWEAHVRELQAGPNPIRNPAVDAMAAWAGVGLHTGAWKICTLLCCGACGGLLDRLNCKLVGSASTLLACHALP